MHRRDQPKVTPAASTVKLPIRKGLNPEQVQRAVAKATGRAVARGIKALSLYHGRPEERWLYNEFRDQKRKIYALYPDNEAKAKGIIKFILVQSGWGVK
jgi:hypothetical protein